METIPQNINPVSIPIPESQIGEFKKSKFIIVLAAIQAISAIPAFLGVISGSYFGILSLLLTVPAAVVLFTKREKIYKIARIFVIFEFVITILFIIALFSLVLMFR